MKKVVMSVLLIALIAPLALAETTPKTLAATMDVYVFPTEGQDSSQQSKDEAECYTWAVSNTGSDPFELQAKNEQAQAQADQAVAQTAQATQGAGAKTAVKGAAAGALIGEIADDDAGGGAAYGAAAGAIAGRRRAKSANKQAQQQAEQQKAASQQATAEGTTNFKKAFSVCLEAKKYMVKF
jgi:hypothetical protein